MNRECIHCGTRCDATVTRCPNCLRSRFVDVADAPPARPRARLGVALAAVALCAVMGVVYALRPGPASTPAPPAALRTASPDSDPLAVGDGLRDVVARIASAPSGAPRGRAVLQALEVRRARLVDDLGEVPPPRAPDLVWRLLPDPNARVTELDLARLVTGVLRAAGEANAAVVTRLRPRRPDLPLDPTASLGAWAVRLGDQVLDVGAGLVVGAQTAPTATVSPTALRAAIAAQAGLEVAPSPGGRSQSLSYANAAVDAWPDGASPLAARARVWQIVGGSGGLDLADADLRAAIALREDAALHLARARVLLGQRRLTEAAQSVRRAATLSPAWGEASVALLAFAPVLSRLDAAAPPGCDALRTARAPWAVDAAALCDPATPSEAREAAARRLLPQHADPLVMAWAARHLGADALAQLRTHSRPEARRELADWLHLLGLGDLAAQLVAGDAGA